MKKIAAVLGIMFVTSVLALPVFALGPGMGRGYGMMGNWGSGSSYCSQGGWYDQKPNQGYRGKYNQEPQNRPAPNRFGRGYSGGSNSYDRGTDRYNNYGHMGGFGMGWWR